MAEPEQKVQRFSSGLFIIQRINNLWNITHREARHGNFMRWNMTLDRIWVELCRDLEEELEEDEKEAGKETEYQKNLNKYNHFEKQLQELMPFEDEEPEGFVTKNKIEMQIKRNKIYRILTDKQVFLARLENHLGKGTTYTEGDDEDWE